MTTDESCCFARWECFEDEKCFCSGFGHGIFSSNVNMQSSASYFEYFRHLYTYRLIED